jgi:peptidyl-prolyl cis-trans isomerase B (cyclophilin B)
MQCTFMAVTALSFALVAGMAFAEGNADSAASGLFAVVKTDKGDIRLELYPEQAPVTVASFVNLAERGYYNGVKFHRVVPGFVIQGGDPTGTGRGGPGYRFEDEFDKSRRHSSAGILSMANSGPRTNGSQFFITLAATPHLDDRHSVFGKVVSGLEVVEAIRQGDAMTSVTIEGDSSALKAKLKDRIAEWNAVLDKEHPIKK